MNNNDDNLKLASVDYVDSKCSGGETKAKAWLCTRNGEQEIGCDYSYLEQYIGSDLESVNYTDSGFSASDVYCHQIAKVVFKEEKSITEVNQWLNFEAKINMGGSQPLCSWLTNMASYGPCAVCPWPDNVPWPSN